MLRTRHAFAGLTLSAAFVLSCAPVSAQQSVSPQVVNGVTSTGARIYCPVGDGSGGSCGLPISGTITATNPSVGANGSANPASSTQMGVSDGTNLQKVVAPIGLGDGVNGNNMVSTGGWVWNGTTWDRMPGSTAGVTTKSATQGSSTGGTAATASGLTGGIYNSTPPTLTNGQQAGTQLTSAGSTKVLDDNSAALLAAAQSGTTTTGSNVPSSAIYPGGRATSAQPTAATDGKLTGFMTDLLGKQVTKPYSPAGLDVTGSASGTDTAAHPILASAGAGLKNYVTDLECGRTDAGTSPITLTFSDASSTVLVLPNAGNGGSLMKTFNVPLRTAAATAFTFTAGTGTTTVYCSAQGYAAP